MKSKKPIVYVLGVPGHFYLAQAVAKEFDRPLIGISSNARTEEKITPAIRANFDKIYSLTDFYFSCHDRLAAMDRPAFDELFQKFEDKIGIENNTMLVNYDRALRWTPDYKTVRIFQLAVMQFIDHFLSEVSPYFILDGVASYLQHALRAACQTKSVPYLLTQNSRLNGHFNLLHTNGQHVGMQEIFYELQKGNIQVVDAEILHKADEAFQNFVSKPIRPAYAEKNCAIKTNPFKTLSNLRETFRPEKLSPSHKVLAFDRKLGYELSPFTYLKKGITGKYRRLEQKVMKVFDNAPDLGVPFIYLPLHYTPECSDMFYGNAYDHHAGFVTQLAKHVPSYCQLYIKEHTSMLGQRPTSFYQELNSLHNVHLIAPSLNTFDLAKKAVCVATVTGTAGWEAFLLGKPVLALGNVFYNFLPGMLHSDISNDLGVKWQNYIQNFKPDNQTLRNAFRAFYATCSESSKGDIGNDIQESQAVDNATKFAQSLRKNLEKWGDTLLGFF